MRSLMKTFSLALAAMAITVLAISCNSLLFVEVDEPEACITLPEQRVPGAPSGSTEVSREESFDFGSVIQGLRSANVQAVMKVLRAELTAKSGVSNFDWVDSLVVQVARPAEDGCADPSVQPVEVFSYQRAGATGSTLVLQGRDVDVAPHLARGNLVFRSTFRGTPPSNDWNIEVKLCVAAKARFEPLGLLNGSKGGGDGQGPSCNPDGGGRTDGGQGGQDGGQGDGGQGDGGQGDGGQGDGGQSDGGTTCAPLGEACGGGTQCCGPASDSVCGNGGTCCHPANYSCGLGNVGCCADCCSGSCNLTTGRCN